MNGPSRTDNHTKNQLYPKSMTCQKGILIYCRIYIKNWPKKIF